MTVPHAAAAIAASHVEHCYGDRRALADLSFKVGSGEIFVFLGPNGGGKTTLFRLLSTLIRPQRGEITVLGFDSARETAAVRRHIGVVFQSPSLDKKLTVAENLRQQAALYGLGGVEGRSRSDEMTARLGLTDRLHERAESLSGGLRRRVELAKGMLHRPRLLLLDEPSTGLDPGARRDLWHYLQEVRERDGVTVALTTHLLEEAERADRIAILNEGRLVALDTPSALKATLGGDSITIQSEDADGLATRIARNFGVTAAVVAGQVRLELPQGHAWVAKLVETFPADIQSITLGKPTLEDVFVARTGHRFWGQEAVVA